MSKFMGTEIQFLIQQDICELILVLPNANLYSLYIGDETSESEIDGDLELIIESDSGSDSDDPILLPQDDEPQPSTSSGLFYQNEPSFVPDSTLVGNVSVPIEIDEETFSIPEFSDCDFISVPSSTPKRKLIE
jgi:hypothetical protein